MEGTKGSTERVFPGFSAYSFVPDTEWLKNENNRNNLESYIYRFRVNYQDKKADGGYSRKEFEFDLVEILDSFYFKDYYNKDYKAYAEEELSFIEETMGKEKEYTGYFTFN